jgi:outer membrane murein-binding lipoprotein Lpp
MRKLSVAVATASLLVAGCGNPGDAAKNGTAASEATEVAPPVADADTAAAPEANAADAKMAPPAEADANSAAEEDDRGGDPGIKSQ